jgi:hypothetical protein
MLNYSNKLLNEANLSLHREIGNYRYRRNVCGSLSVIDSDTGNDTAGRLVCFVRNGKRKKLSN